LFGQKITRLDLSSARHLDIPSSPPDPKAKIKTYSLGFDMRCNTLLLLLLFFFLRIKKTPTATNSRRQARLTKQRL
jgi:hypothetical protein